jgi:hypothetical protein
MSGFNTWVELNGRASVIGSLHLRAYPETGVFSKRYMTTGYGFAQNASSYLGEQASLMNA